MRVTVVLWCDPYCGARGVWDGATCGRQCRDRYRSIFREVSRWSHIESMSIMGGLAWVKRAGNRTANNAG